MRPSTLNYSRCRARLRGGRGDSVKFRVLSRTTTPSSSSFLSPLPPSGCVNSALLRVTRGKWAVGSRGDERRGDWTPTTIARSVMIVYCRASDRCLSCRARTPLAGAISPGSLAKKHANKSSGESVAEAIFRGPGGRFTVARRTARRFGRDAPSVELGT